MTVQDTVSWLYSIRQRLYKEGRINRQEWLTIKQIADTLEEQEERIAIMMEGNQISEDKYQQMRIEARG